MEWTNPPEPPNDELEENPADRPLPGKPRAVVLLVDDETQIRKLVAMLLTCDGYFVLSAADGHEGLVVSRQFAGWIDLVVSDLEMPRKCGDELCADLARER